MNFCSPCPCLQNPRHVSVYSDFSALGSNSGLYACWTVPFHLNYIWPQLRPQLCPQPSFSPPCLGPRSSSSEEALLSSITALTGLSPLMHTPCSPPKSLPSRTPSYLCYQLQGLSPENGTPSFVCILQGCPGCPLFPRMLVICFCALKQSLPV